MGRSSQTTKVSEGPLTDDGKPIKAMKKPITASKTVASKTVVMQDVKPAATKTIVTAKKKPATSSAAPVVDGSVSGGKATKARIETKKQASKEAKAAGKQEAGTKKRRKRLIAHLDDENVAQSILREIVAQERLSSQKPATAAAPFARAMRASLNKLGPRYYGPKSRDIQPGSNLRCFKVATMMMQKSIEAILGRIIRGSYNLMRQQKFAGVEKKDGAGKLLWKRPITLRRGHIISYIGTQKNLLPIMKPFFDEYVKEHPEIAHTLVA